MIVHQPPGSSMVLFANKGENFLSQLMDNSSCQTFGECA